MRGPAFPADGSAGRLHWSAAAGIPVPAVPATANDAEPAKIPGGETSRPGIGRLMLCLQEGLELALLKS
jgi:hypothetical protein